MNQIAPTGSVSDVTADDRELIRQLADVVIPAVAPFPSGAEASVHTKWIDRGLTARPDLVVPLLSVARQCADEPAEEVVARLVRVDADAIEPVIELLIACYFMSPKVRKRLNYKGQVANPILPGETEHYLREGLLTPVAHRPPMWRTTPDDPARASMEKEN